MRARLLRLAEVSDDEWERWAALAERAAEPNAALDPRFLRPDRESSGGQLLVVAEEDDEWLGLVRVFSTNVSATLPIASYGTLEPSDLGPPYPLLDRAHAAEALTVIARGVRRLLHSGYLPLQGYPAFGPLAEAMQRLQRRPALGAIVVATNSAPWVDVHPGQYAPDERVFVAQTDPDHRSVSSRKELRRSARRLAEAGGGPLSLHDASDDPAAIDRFVAMQASGWKGDRDNGGYAVALDPERERAFRGKADAFRASGDLIVLELRAGTQLIYSHVYVVSGNVALGILDAYQHEYGRFSAGKLGRTAASAHLRHLPRLEAVNPGYYYYTDDEAMKVFPDRREFADIVVGVGVVPSLAVRLLPRAEKSPLLRKILIAMSRADRFAMRALNGLQRRLKPKT